MTFSHSVGAFVIAISLIVIPGSWGTSDKSKRQFSPAASEPVLPPVGPWNGKSRALLVRQDNPWITPAEKSDFRLTPSYDETTAWLQKLVAAAPQLKMISLGKSPEDRDISMIIATHEKDFTPEALRKSNKPTILAQAGIHSGEIDGKDAGLMDQYHVYPGPGD